MAHTFYQDVKRRHQKEWGFMANRRRKHIKDSDMEWVLAALLVLLLASILTWNW
jgi:hypothetical protein